MASGKNVITALQLIDQYEPDAVFTAEHDQIWYGEGRGKSITEITDEGKVIMEGLGWFIDDSVGCWSRFV